MVTLEEVKRVHYELWKEARDIVSKKGADYNRQQQNDGDTLFNLKVSSIIGVTDSTTQGILVRLTDKLMRLISLTKDPLQEAEVKDESVKDTIKDSINYLVYLYCIYKEVRDAEQFDLAAMFEEPRKLTEEEMWKERQEAEKNLRKAIHDDDELPSTGTYRS